VPLPVIIVKVEGPYTERDRKLWTFLLHAVWDELGEKPIHTLPVTKVNQVFRACGGEHDSNWIWDSAERLTRTIVQWIRTEGDTRYKGIASLFQAEITEDAKENGKLRFAFPALLIPIIKDPRRFARLRVHFLLRLSGKYAVTLYEVLEAVANKDSPVLLVSLPELRQWLKIPEGQLPRFANINQRILKPALEQINRDPLGAGFTVAMQPVKKDRAVHSVRFMVQKTNGRAIHESGLKNASQSISHDSLRLSPGDFEKAKAAAPGWDVYQLEREWQDWIATRDKPEKPGPAFVAFCRQKYRREGRRH
jgi:hypothetical protein